MFRSNNEAALKSFFWLVSLSASAVLFLIVFFLVWEARDAWSVIGLKRFLTDEHWSPTISSESPQFGLLPMIVGSLLAALGSVLIAGPLGVGAAVFAQYYAPAGLRIMFVRLVELLGAIPSVVYGLWGLVVLVPLIADWQPPGASLLAGVMVLVVMILPTVMLLTLSVLEQVPAPYIHSAAALGFSSSSTFRKVVLPAARSGIATAIVLAITRAIGETMVVLMVCGNVIAIPHSIFDPVRTLTANIALEMAYATGLHRSSLFLTGLMVIAVVILFVMISELFRGRSKYV